MKIRLISGAAAAAMLFASPALAAPVVLSNGTGDGDVSVRVSGTGTFGTSGLGGANSGATYNPVGPGAAATTTFDSFNYIRIGTSGGRTNFSTFASTDGASTATSFSSTFTGVGLNFALQQNVSDAFTGMSQTGSLLTQTYTITNPTSVGLDFEIIRYLDGDLAFDGSIADGGGTLMSGGNLILFETDTAIGSSMSNTFVGIQSLGGAMPMSGAWEVDSFSGLRSRIIAGTALDQIVTNDGADADTFIDAGAGYDVTLGLRRTFSLAAGQSTTYTTYTIFGSGVPESVVIGPGAIPEPGTWAMMLLGFGGLGAVLRRRRAGVALAA